MEQRGGGSKTGQQYGTRVNLADYFYPFVRNPDSLIKIDRNGYQTIYGDDVIYAETQTLFGPLKSAPITVTGYGDPWDAILTEFYQEDPNLPEAIEQAAFMLFEGFRPVEKIWGIRTAHEVTETQSIDFTLLAPVDYQVHDPFRFAFTETGDLFITQDGYLPNVGWLNYNVNTESGKAQWVDPRRMMLFRYADGDGRYGYGEGIGALLYRYVMAKQSFYTHALNYAAGFSVPRIDVTLSEDYIIAAQGPGVQDVQAVLDWEYTQELNRNAGGLNVSREGRETKFIEPPSLSDASGYFDTMIRVFNDAMRHMITGETVTTQSDKMGGGSLAKSKEAKRIPMMRRKRLADAIAKVLTREHLWQVVEANRGVIKVLNPKAGRVMLNMPQMDDDERLELMLKLPVDVLKDELYEATGAAKPSVEQISKGQTVIPNPPKNPAGEPPFGMGL